MNCMHVVAGSMLLASSLVAQSATVFVQHQQTVNQGAIFALDSGPGFTLSADLVAGDFKIFAIASATVPVNNNFSGTNRPVEFTNDTGAPVVIGAGGLRASVHANFFHDPSERLGTTMRARGSMSVRVVGGAGMGEFAAAFRQNVTVVYNLDGTVKDVIAEYLPSSSNGATVLTGPGGGLGGANVHFLMPTLLLDPGARLHLSFQIGGDAHDASTTEVYNTLTFELPAGVMLTNDVGQTLAWVTSVPEPRTYALLLAGIGLIYYAARRRGFARFGSHHDPVNVTRFRTSRRSRIPRYRTSRCVPRSVGEAKRNAG